MAAETFSSGANPAPHGIERVRDVDRHILGVGFFISSEAVFFASLIIAFVVYHGRDFGAAARLDVSRTAVFTFLLLSSSATVVMSERRLRAGDHGGGRLWLLFTILLGVAFLVNQGVEYWGLLSEAITPQSNLWATTFFTLTGFHGLHVFAGLIALSIVLGVALARSRPGRGHSALSAVSLYWHFVDGIWIIVFSLAYLWR